LEEVEEGLESHIATYFQISSFQGLLITFEETINKLALSVR
jgi:hypothetical protein